jgi:CRISPR-associated protein Cas2
MAQQQHKAHIIAYDIGDPKRLTRIHRYLKKLAMPIQYSVFLIECNAKELQEVRDHLQEMINPKQDDIRIYTLPLKPVIMTLGKQALFQGIYLLSGDNDYFSGL